MSLKHQEYILQAATNVTAVAMAMGLLDHIEETLNQSDGNPSELLEKVHGARLQIESPIKDVNLYDYVSIVKQLLTSESSSVESAGGQESRPAKNSTVCSII